jgi:hypothetical protein
MYCNIMHDRIVNAFNKAIISVSGKWVAGMTDRVFR